MRAVVMIGLVLVLASPAEAQDHLRWYRGFYARVGGRDSFGAEETFHTWAAPSFGIGYRFERDLWGIDASALDLQYDPEEGMHTAARIVPYVSFERWLRVDLWLGAGLSYGWVKGTVDEAISKRRGEGLQGEVMVGCELPRAIRARMFVQATATLPFYNVYDMYHSLDSTLYVYALEAAIGLRF